MPYTTDRDKLESPFLKRNVKLLECQKVMVNYHHLKGMSIHSLSKLFRVSRRTIQFILYPERQAKNLEDRDKRGGTRQYYDKEKHKDYMKTHRRYKHKTLKEMKRPATLYYIAYYQGTRLVEEIRKTQPMTRTLCRHVINELRRTTHKTGQLIPEIWK